MKGQQFQRENLFKLARRVKDLEVTPRAVVFSPSGAEVCRRLGANAEDLHDAMRDAVDRVKTGKGSDALAVALRIAKADASRFPVPDESPFYAVLVATAYHLGQRAGPDGWVPFGSARLSEALGLHRNTIDSAVKRLEAMGLIRVLRDKNDRVKFSFTRGESRMVRYVGPEPPEPAYVEIEV